MFDTRIYVKSFFSCFMEHLSESSWNQIQKACCSSRSRGGFSGRTRKWKQRAWLPLRSYSQNSTSVQSEMEEKGTKIRIVSKHGYSYASMLSVEVVQDNLRISWRSVPEKLGVDMMHLKEIVQSSISDCCLHLLFQGQLRTDCSAATDEEDLH